MKKLLFAVAIFLCFLACKEDKKEPMKQSAQANETIPESVKKIPFVWEGANIYFLLTDRFNNGNTDNDVNFERTDSTGVLRGFMGGDIEGITQKINDGYFSELGVNAIWFTPVVEQIHGVDKESEDTYGYHG